MKRKTLNQKEREVVKRSDISSLTVLESCAEAHKISNKKGSWEIIYDKTNAPEKVIYASMEREEKRGYLECGISLRTAWLSQKGKEKLEELRVNHAKAN